MAIVNSTKLVENGIRHYGRFLKTPIANPLDEFSGLKRIWENFRTKEWAGFMIAHPEIHSAIMLQNAKYVKSSEIHIYDIATGEMNDHNAVASTLAITTDLLHDSPCIKTKKYFVGYEFSDNQVKIKIDIAATKTAKAFKGEIILDASNKSHALVVSAKLPPHGTMYTNKYIYPASGYLQAGDKRYEFDVTRDLLILDEHKSHLPYFNTNWEWGTFAFPADGNFVGANFVARPYFADQEEETCLWTPDACEPLTNVTFKQLNDSENSSWKIKSADGRLDVVFIPHGRKDVQHNFFVAMIDYFQMFGTYSGTIRGANKTWTFENIHGICEKMKMRS